MIRHDSLTYLHQLSLLPTSRVIQAEAPKHAEFGPRVLGSSLRRAFSLNPWLLDKPPGTGAQEAGNQNCMVEISQFVWALVWTNPSNGMEIEIPSGRAPEIMDVS